MNRQFTQKLQIANKYMETYSPLHTTLTYQSHKGFQFGFKWQVQNVRKNTYEISQT